MLGIVEQSQQTLERLNAEMQQRVSERTVELQQVNHALAEDIAARIKAEQDQEMLRAQLLHSQKMEAVGTLAGGIAHDFNNILTGILGYAQLLAFDIPEDHPASESVRQINAAAKRASSLVRQILTFSRQKSGEKIPLGASRVVHEAVVLLRAALPSNIDVQYAGLNHGDTVCADATQIHQVLMNLGTNAGHAMRAAGGILRIEVARVRARRPVPGDSPASEPKEMIRIEVADTGTGIPPEIMSKIFDPFFSTKPISEGTGLGLAMVHGIVENHGGWVEVTSEPGKGARFVVFLPAIEGKPPATGSASPFLITGKERVLLVDDEGLVLGALEKNLKMLGYQVRAINCPTLALAHFNIDPSAYDLVITDYMMPGMTGLNFAREIKSRRSDLPVVLMTGYSPEVSGKTAEELGVQRILDKPINVAFFSGCLREVLAASGRPVS